MSITSQQFENYQRDGFLVVKDFVDAAA